MLPSVGLISAPGVKTTLSNQIAGIIKRLTTAHSALLNKGNNQRQQKSWSKFNAHSD